MDYLPTCGRPQWVVVERQTTAEITYTDCQTGGIVWRQSFEAYNPIPPPPADLPTRDYAVSVVWREDWR